MLKATTQEERADQRGSDGTSNPESGQPRPHLSMADETLQVLHITPTKKKTKQNKTPKKP